MEPPAYEGRTGGKFRRRPFRRPVAKPYDRPPSAVRGLRGIATAAGSGSGWLSKLVDPASRFIARSASKLFSSMFRKMLTAPPEGPGSEQNCQIRLSASDLVGTAPSELLDQKAVDVHNGTGHSETNGISDIEQLLRQKKYTRAQVHYLTELISSRTIEPISLELEGKERVNVSEEGNMVRNSWNEYISGPSADLTDVAASPAEIAKAYLSSRSPKADSSVVNLQSRDFCDDQSMPRFELCTPKSPDLSVAPRSVIRLSEVDELSGMRRHTPRPRGSSAIYRMYRSPYFKVDPVVNLKGNEYGKIGKAGPSSSQWTPSSASKTDGKQVLKQSSSVLYGDYGSFGPIRRIRQKSNLISASKDARFVPSSNIHVSPSFHLNNHDTKGFISTQKNSTLNEIKYGSADLQIMSKGEKIFSSNVCPDFGHVSETGLKLLEQLDKLAPSPKEKFNMKHTAMDESPYKLTADMLNGRALKSMGNVDSSQLISMDTSCTFDSNNDENSQTVIFSQSEQPGQFQVRENVPSMPSVSGVKSASAANGMSRAAISSRNVRPSFKPADSISPVDAALFPQKKPAFQMTAPEDSLELDDEHDVTGASVQSISDGGETAFLLSGRKASISAMSGLEKQIFSSSKSMSDSSSIPLAEANKKANDLSYISQKESFTFPVATDIGDYSQPPPTPTMPSPSLDKLAPQSEQIVAPVFSFGSRSTDAPVSLPAATVTSESPRLKTSIESIPQATSMNNQEGSNLAGVKMVADDMSKFSGSGFSTLGATASISFGTSAISDHSNGPINSPSLISPVSASTMETINPTQGSLFLSSSTSGATGSSNPSILSSSPLLTPSNIPTTTSKSDSVDSGAKAATNSLFGYFSPPTQVTSSSLIVGGNTFIVSSPVSGEGIASSALAMPSSSSSTTFSSASLASYLLSAVSPSVPSESNGLGYSTASPPSISTISTSSNSLQNSSDNIGSVGKSIFVVQPAQSSNGNSFFSQSLTTQPCSSSSSSTLGLSSSSSVFGSSLSSSPTFGLSSSSFPGFGHTPFGTNQSAKPSGLTSAFPFSSSSTTTNSGTGFSFSSGVGASSLSSGSSTSRAIVSNSSFGLSFSTGSSGFSFSASAGSSNAVGSTFSPAATSGLFGNSSQGSAPSVSGSVFGSSPSTGLSFGLSTPASGASSFGFGSSGGSVFSFTSSTATTATVTPAFGMPNTAGGFSTVSQNNDQMSVEDTMTVDTNQPPAPVFPSFGQPNSTDASQNFVFGSAIQSGAPPVFQFGSQQNASVMQSQNPFQSGSNLDFALGGSFSLGSGGDDKSTRKFVKVRRDKTRRK